MFLHLKQLLENLAPDLVALPARPIVADQLAVAPVLEQIAGRRTAHVAVNLQRGLIRRKRNQIPSIRAKLSQIARRFLHVDHRRARQDVLVKLSDRVRPQTECAILQPVDNVLGAKLAELDALRTDKLGFAAGGGGIFSSVHGLTAHGLRFWKRHLSCFSCRL